MHYVYLLVLGITDACITPHPIPPPHKGGIRNAAQQLPPAP
jgi:hypothetical protein